MVRNPVRTLFAALLATLLGAAPAFGADKVKIGFITTLSGPAGIIGKDMKQSVELAVEHLGGKMAGLPIEVIFGDDQRKPDVGKQLAEQMIKKDRVDFVSGIIWSNIMLAVAPTVTSAGVIMVGTNAGPHQLAGEMCDKRFFTTSWQNDSTPEAMGKHLQDLGLNDVYLIAPNYAAGKDMLTGFKRYFKGRISAEVYTKLGQQDYQAEISQLRASSSSSTRRPDCADRFRCIRCTRSTSSRCRQCAMPRSASSRHATGAPISTCPRTRSSSAPTRKSTASCPRSTARRATTASC